MRFRGFLNTVEEVDTEYAKAIEKGVRFVLKLERVNNFSGEEVSRYEDFDPMSEKQVKEIISEWKDMDNRLVAELKEKNNDCFLNLPYGNLASFQLWRYNGKL